MKVSVFVVGYRNRLVAEVMDEERVILIDGCSKLFGGIDVVNLPIPADTKLSVRLVDERLLEWHLESANPRAIAVFNGVVLENGVPTKCPIGGPFVNFQMTIGYAGSAFMRLLVEKEAA